MSVELIFCIVIAAAATLLPRILKTERRHRREVSKILIVTGTVCSGILAGLLASIFHSAPRPAIWAYLM